MQGPTTLIIFAHRPEAQSFLKNDQLKAIEGITPHLYQGTDYYLLICGEGIFSALQNTSLALSQLNEIEEVWNLGIAGGLNYQVELNEIYPIRSCYGEIGNEVQFKSYSSQFPTTTIDCISSGSRVLEKQQADTLSNFAPVVDRECWGIGMVCQQLKINFYPIKMISDFPAENKVEICSIVKEKAEFYSDTLYRWWIDKRVSSRTKVKKENYQKHFPELYFTLSMERKLTQYIDQLKSRHNTIESLISEIKDSPSYREIIGTKATEKQKSLLFLDLLKTLINPKLTAVDSQLKELSRDLVRVGAKINFDPSYEDNFININIQLTNEVEKDNFIDSLKRFSFHNLKEVLQGKPLD